MTTTDSFWLWGLLPAFVLPLFIALLPSGIAGMAAFIGANVLTSISLVAYASSLNMPSVFASGVFHSAGALALALLYIGVRQFLGLDVPVRQNRIPILCGVALLAVMLNLFQNASVQTMLFSAAHAMVLGSIGYELIRMRSLASGRLAWAYVAVLMLVLSVLHGLCALAHGTGLGVVGQTSSFAAAAREFNFLAWVLVPAMFLGLALLVHDRIVRTPKAARTLDHLTGAHTKRTFLRSLADEGRRSGRSGSQFALLLLDIDALHEINAGHGRATGDEVLRHVSTVVRSHVRGIDRFARLDGRTFALLMHDTDEAGALAVCTRLRDRLRHESCRMPDGSTIAITTSGGLTVWHSTDANRDVLGRADMALKHAKTIGRDTVVVASAEPSSAPRFAMAPWAHRSTSARTLMSGPGG